MKLLKKNIIYLNFFIFSLLLKTHKQGVKTLHFTETSFSGKFQHKRGAFPPVQWNTSCEHYKTIYEPSTRFLVYRVKIEEDSHTPNLKLRGQIKSSIPFERPKMANPRPQKRILVLCGDYTEDLEVICY